MNGELTSKREWLTYREAGEIAHKSIRQIKRWVQEGKLCVSGRGPGRKIERASLVAFQLSVTTATSSPKVFNLRFTNEQNRKRFVEFLRPMVEEILNGKLKNT